MCISTLREGRDVLGEANCLKIQAMVLCNRQHSEALGLIDKAIVKYEAAGSLLGQVCLLLLFAFCFLLFYVPMNLIVRLFVCSCEQAIGFSLRGKIFNKMQQLVSAESDYIRALRFFDKLSHRRGLLACANVLQYLSRKNNKISEVCFGFCRLRGLAGLADLRFLGQEIPGNGAEAEPRPGANP